MIVESLILDPVLKNAESQTDLCRAMVYPLSSSMINSVMSFALPGTTVFLFSGSWRLDIDAVYLELRHYKHSSISWHPRTLFVEPQDTVQYHYVLGKMRCDNLIVMHSDYWCGHRPLEHIIKDLDCLRQFSARAICSVPIKHANFNKLTMNLKDLCEKYVGINIIDDSLLMIR